jgi:uncharacterized protein (DUF608 family)
MPVKRLPYSASELRGMGPQRTFTGRQLDEIAFPLGGIGTGSVSLGGWGQLRDWEIFNRPAKGNILAYSFFTLRVQAEGEEPVARVLQGPTGGTYTGRGSGVERLNGAGLPHFRRCSFTGAFPFATVQLQDPQVPLRASIEAFSPFIPLDDRDSSIPVAIFLVRLANKGKKQVRATLFANLENAVGRPELGQNLNSFVRENVAAGLSMTTRKHPPDSPRYGSLALATPWRRLTFQTRWPREGWFDALALFWRQLTTRGRLADDASEDPSPEGQTDIGSIGLIARIEPGKTATLPVVIAWHFPNFEMYWAKPGPDGRKPVWKNYYASLFKDAWDVARYVCENLKRLESETRLFQKALFSTSLPSHVLDAVSSQLSTLRTNTCLRLADGAFYGFEGCNNDAGCCEGSCTHVWNYAQALPYLFPALERSMREADYEYNLHDDGHMTFRLPLPLGTRPEPAFHAAADGQMGGVMKTYRDWLISGDNDWLRKLWPRVKLALGYAWKAWDADRDGVMEGVQHNTYDIEFHGPNTMIGSFYLGALRAGEEMAKLMAEPEKAAEYREVFERGKAWMDKHLFNGGETSPKRRDRAGEGGWYVQETDSPDRRYQYGPGCLSDQLIGQWCASMLGLGYLFDRQKVKEALSSIFRYNWREDLFTHANPQRIYALDGEAGLLVCSWPRGGRPEFPFPYSDEVWTGIEYQVASHLIYEGFVDEALAIVKAARQRHDGERRNPWDEFECGHHYARAMSSYALLLALSGFRYCAAEGLMGFAPRLNAENFRCFWSVDSGWGIYRQKLAPKAATLSHEVLRGSLALKLLTIQVPARFSPRAASARVGAKRVHASLERDREIVVVKFAETVALRAGQRLSVAIR